MKLLALAFVLGCGSSKPTHTDTTTPTGSATTTTTTTIAGSGSATPVAAAAKPQYSCFSYASKNSTQRRHACSKTDECTDYLDQAKTVPGLKDFTGCENIATVFCFHQAATKDDPDGRDICQPTLDECKAGRADVVKAKMSVDSDCAQK